MEQNAKIMVVDDDAEIREVIRILLESEGCEIVEAENGATAGKFDLAKRAKAANLDAIHDTVHEMARDEARHGKAFEGLLKRYFG